MSNDDINSRFQRMRVEKEDEASQRRLEEKERLAAIKEKEKATLKALKAAGEKLHSLRTDWEAAAKTISGLDVMGRSKKEFHEGSEWYKQVILYVEFGEPGVVIKDLREGTCSSRFRLVAEQEVGGSTITFSRYSPDNHEPRFEKVSIENLDSVKSRVFEEFAIWVAERINQKKK